MRTFQVFSVALLAAAANGQYLSNYRSYGGYGTYGLGLGGTLYGASYSPSVIRTIPRYSSSATYGTTYAVPATVSYSSRSLVPAPGVLVAAAPAVSISAAPAVSYSSGVRGGFGYDLGRSIAYNAGSGGAIVTGSGGGIRSHEIHTGGAPNSILVQEYKAGGQLIRVHDGPQAGTEVINVQGPAASANHIRLVSRIGPTQVQRSVSQDPSVQVFDVVNPPKPADRVINIRKAPAPPAQVELVAEHQQTAPEITVGGDEPNVQIQRVGGAGAIGGGSIREDISGARLFAIAAPAVSTIAAAPAVSTIAAAPISTIAAAPVTTTIAATPISTVSSVPALSYSTGYGRLAGTTYGTSYGGLYGYGVSGNAYGSTAVLGRKKAASA